MIGGRERGMEWMHRGKKDARKDGGKDMEGEKDVFLKGGSDGQKDRWMEGEREGGAGR